MNECKVILTVDFFKKKIHRYKHIKRDNKFNLKDRWLGLINLKELLREVGSFRFKLF